MDMTSVSSSKSEPTNQSFQYDVLESKRTRFFKLDLNGEDEPLSGRLMSAYHNQNSLDLSSTALKNLVREDTNEVMEWLSDGSGYDAVSYTWGNSDEPHSLKLSTISCKLDDNNLVQMDHEPDRMGNISVTSNLSALLQQLRKRKYNRFIWIDAICINQADDDEKSRQIPMMRDIYEYAQQVYVWLGEASPPEKSALTMLPGLTKAMQAVASDGWKLDPTRPETFESAGLPEPDHVVWRSIGGILSRPYWSRLWTLQEVVVPDDKRKGRPIISIICGDTTNTLETFDLFALAAVSAEFKAWVLTGQWGLWMDSLLGFDSLAEIRTCRESYHRYGFAASLSALLVATRRRKASVKADMVFGMLAMLDHAQVRKLAIDISQATEKVYIAFAKHYVRNEVKETLLNHVATQERLDSLPSWCPNFASSPETISLGSRWLGHYESPTEHRAQMCHAGFQKHGKWKKPRSRLYYAMYIANPLMGRHSLDGSYDTKNPRQIALVPATDHILASGIHVDTVAAVVDCNGGAEAAKFFSFNALEQTLDWNARCLSLAKGYLPEGSEGFDIFARTLVANRVTMDPAENEPIVFDRLNELDMVSRYLEFKRYLDATITVGEIIPVAENISKEALQYANVMSRITRRRRFFATAGGRIGLGPATTSIGDAICVLFYCPTPYLLRESSSGRHRLVGEAYVHGLMYGEVLDMFDRHEVREMKWTVE